MRRILPMVAICLVVGFVDIAAAQQTQVAKQVDALLGGIEYVPKASEWTALGPEAAQVLVSIAKAKQERPSRRARAISALAHFPTPETRTFLETIASDPTLKTVLRRKALRALSHAYQGEALAFVQGFVAVEDKHLREAAVKSLAEIGTPQARLILEERRKVESAAFVRETIEKSLRR